MAILKFHSPDRLGEPIEWGVDDHVRIWINGFRKVVDEWKGGCKAFYPKDKEAKARAETGCDVVKNPRIVSLPVTIRIKAENIGGPGAIGPLNVTDLITGNTRELIKEQVRTREEGVFFDKTFTVPPALLWF